MLKISVKFLAALFLCFGLSMVIVSEHKEIEAAIGDCTNGGTKATLIDRKCKNPVPCNGDENMTCLEWSSGSTSRKKWEQIKNSGTCGAAPLSEIIDCKECTTALICATGNKFNTLADCDANTNPTPIIGWNGKCLP